jgi:VCBS repeat-containing protein
MNNFALAINVLTESLSEIYADLTSLVQSDRWQPIIQASFGGEILVNTAQRIQQAWTVGDFSDLKISIAGADTLGGAQGAYVSGDRSIYISADLLQRNNPAAVKSVLLEEIGHYLDDRLNNGKDTPGEEGELFARLEQGQILDPAELAQLRAKDNIGSIAVNGQLVAAELAPGDYVNGNLKDLKDGIDGFFTKIKTQLQSLVETELNATKGIPLVGAKIVDLSTSASDKALDFLSSVQTKINEKFAQAAGSSQLIKTGLAEAFGKSGLDLLKDLTGDGVADEKDITLAESATNLQVNFSLEAKPSALNDTNSDDFSLGTSWLGVKGAATIGTNFGATLNLGFGFDDTNGFYVDTSGTKDKSEFIVNLGAAIPTLNLEGNLGPFQAKISNQTGLGAGFIKTGLAIDLKAKAAPLTADRLYTKEFSDVTIVDNLKADVSGSAGLNLHAESKVSNALPSIVADLDIQWDDFIKKPNPTGKFKNVILDSGTFVKAFNPIFQTLKDINDPVRPVVDLLKFKLPLIKKSIVDLSDSSDILSLPGQTETNKSFLTQFVNTSDLIQRSTGFGGTITLIGSAGIAIPFPVNLPVAPASIEPLAATDGAISPSAAPAIPPEGQQVLDQLGVLDDVKGLAALLSDPSNPDFQIPLFTDPLVTIPKLLTGVTTDLITLKLPTFQTGFSAKAFIPVLGPIGVELNGKLGAALNLKFGYDSSGWNDFSKSNYADGSKFANGLYLESFKPDVDKYGVFPLGVNQDPKDDPKFDKFIVGVGGGIYGGIGVGFGAGSVTVGGGLNASLKLVPADLSGRVRIADLANPGCVLLPHGKVDAYLGGKLRLGFGPFSISKTVVLARANLLNYTAECDSRSRKDLGQAKKGVDGVLELQTTNVDDVFTVKHSPATAPGTVSIAGNEILEVEAGGTLPLYGGIKSITNNNLTDGNDIITLDPGVLSPAVLRGGSGFDQLDGGAGSDQLYGDGDADVLVGNAGNDSIYGGADDDALTGGAGSDLLDGGAGLNFATYAADPNRIVAISAGGSTAIVRDGYGGTDALFNIQQLEGSNFADYVVLNASNQNLVVFGLDGNDNIFTGSGDDFLLGGEGADTMNGGAGEDATSYADSWDSVDVNLATTYADGGTASGDRLYNIEDVQGSIFDDILVGNSRANKLDGNIGADTIEGGAGADTLTAGESNNPDTNHEDLVTYKHSIFGVNVNITADASVQNTGGDAQGDVLFAPPTSYSDDGITLTTPADVFGKLEGSQSGDTLTGNQLDNIIYGLAGGDIINGGAGDDTLVGGSGGDRFDGGTGSDWVDYSVSESGSATFVSDADNNVFPTTGVTVDLTGVGQGGDAQGDTFVAANVNGNQVATVENIRGTDFGDKLYGDAGNNIIAPGLGVDFVDGRGSGRDILQVDYGIRDIGTGINALGNSPNSATPGSVITRWDNNGNILDQVTYQNIESLQLTGTIQNDKVGGTDGNDIIDVQDGNDLVYGYGGNDNIDGGDGNDTLSGGDDYDNLKGGDGEDFLNGDAGNDNLNGGSGDDIVFGGSDAVGVGTFSPGGHDSLSGDEGNDLLIGGVGEDRIFGGDGRDLLIGSRENDILHGDAGDDVLVGGDSLAARTLYYRPQNQNQLAVLAVAQFNPANFAYSDDYAGADTLTGGAGADQFWLDFSEGGDGIDRDYTTITDYTPTEGDKIVVPVLDRSTIGDGGNYLLDPNLGMTQYGGVGSPFFLKQVGADVQIFVATLINPPANPVVPNSVSLVDNSGTDTNTAIIPSANLIGGGVLEPIVFIDPIIFQPVITAQANQIALVQNTTLDKIVLTLPAQLLPPATPASITPLAATVATIDPLAASNTIPLSTSTVEPIDTVDNATIPLVTAAPAFTVAQTSDATALLNKFLSPDALTGLKNVKVKVIGDSRAFGIFANDPFGLNDGLVLSTGRVKDLPGVNKQSGSPKTPGFDLSNYLGEYSSTPDKVALEIEFDTTETDKNLFFQYVYGSEELTEFGGTQFYDPFSVTLNGQSLAKLSDGKAVNINNLANAQDGPYHPDLILNSPINGPAKDIIKLDGYTKPETFIGNIRTGHNKLVIKLRDQADGKYDSAVFLKANSLSTILPPTDLPIGGADAVIVTPAQIEVTEGDTITNSFEVKLQGAIAAPVTITITPDPQVFIGNITDPMTGDIITPTESKPITLTFTPSNSGTAQSIFVKAIDDAVIQGKRTVPITLTTSSADARFDKLVIIPEQVVINDNEKYTVGISTSQDATEGTIDGNFIITLDAPAPVGGLIVNYSLAGAATTPADYNLTAGTNISGVTATSFTIAPGQTTATLKVIAINDNLAESTEDVQLQLQAGSEYVLGSTSSKSLNLLDNTTRASVAPTGTDKTVTIDEDTAYTFTVADFGFTDAGDVPSNIFTKVTITTLPTAGTLKVGSVAVNAGDIISVADIPQLTFSPIVNANGADYGNFSFQVQDDGSAIAGGAFIDPTANTVTVNVAPINDPALISGTSTAAVTKNLDRTIPLLSTTGKLAITDIDLGEEKFRTTVTSVGSNLGTLTIDPVGNYSYNVSNLVVQNLLGGQTKVETFTVQSFDGSATQNISVTINGVNDIVIPPANTAKIQGSVWNDLDGSSSRGANEPGLLDWTVYLDQNGNNQLDPTETKTTTKADGSYEFAGLAAGTYNVNEVLQTNWKQTFPTPTTLSTTAAEIELFSPAVTVENSPSPTASSTTNPTALIQLDRLSQDSRFMNIKGQGLTTVFIDTGVDVNHPIFGADKNGDGIADRIVYQYDFADGDTDASDISGHGSHVASIASQIAPESNIIVLKVFKDSGTGSFADLEKALQWVATNAKTYNVGAVNLSLGDSGNWNTAQSRYGIGDELAAIASQNIITASATGNDFFKDASVQGNAYPAADPNVIGVGAVWASSTATPQKFTGGAIDYAAAPDRIASFSQRSATLGNIFAPGIFINGATATGGMSLISGTSEAVPFVSGVAILAQQIAQSKLGRKLTIGEFRTLLATTSDIIQDGDDESTNVTSTGATFPRLNALALAEGILKLSPAVSAIQVEPGNGNGTNAPALTTYAIGRNIVLLAGQTATGIDFGNQIIPNRPPALAGSPFVFLDGLEDTAYTFTDANLLAGYTDPDGNPLTVDNLTATNGSIVKNGSNYTFTPTTNYNGVVNLTYNVTDGSSGLKAATNSFNLAPVNDIAIIDGIATASVTKNTSKILTVSNKLNITDVDAGEDKFNTTVIPIGTTLGKLTIDFLGNYSYSVPNSDVQNLGAGQTKIENFTVKSSDGSATKDISITINGAIDPSITVVATDPSATEGGDGGQVTFTRTGGLLDDPLTINYNTSTTGDGTSSYGNTPGKLTFPTGSSTVTLPINIPTSDVYTRLRQVSVISGNGYTIGVGGDTGATINVTSAKPLPTLTIGDVSIIEGNDGKTNAVFTVALSGKTADSVTVDYATADGTALNSSDYAKVAGKLTFAPEETSKTITVEINGDNNFEDNETFFVNLSNPTNTTSTKPKGIGTILNDDKPIVTLVVTIPNAAEKRQEEPATPGRFTLTRTGSTTNPLTVNYDIAGTATENTDYTSPGAHKVTFAAGSDTATIDLKIIDDKFYEGTETVILKLTSSKDYLLDGDSGTVIIEDNELPQPNLRYQPTNNLINIDGGSKTSTLQFTKLSHQAGKRNEMGMFAVDDANGTINGIKAGAAGYLQAAMNRSSVIFSGLSETNTDRYLDNIVQRHLSINPGIQYQFYLVDDSTTDQVKADLATGKTPTSVIFSQPDANIGKFNPVQFTTLTNNSSYQIEWDDSGTDGDKDFNDMIVIVEALATATPLGTQLQGTQKLVDLSDSGSVNLQATITGDAAYNNTLGFYTVDDVAGQIGTLRPGDLGYANAALNRSVMSMTKADVSKDQIFKGSILAPYLIANGTARDVLSATNAAQMPQVYFGYVGANRDGQEHIRLLGDNKFAFEDQFGGGDRDFNDVIVQIKVTPFG